MAGPLTIQRVPRGMLDFLGLRGAGELPSQLAGALVGTLEVGPLYALELSRTISSLQTTVAAGFVQGPSNATAVPSGELWVVTNLSVEIGNGITTAFTGALGFKRAQDNAGPARIVLPNVNVPVSSTLNFGHQAAFGTIILLPGDAIGLRVNTTGVSSTAFFSIDYFRMLI